MQYNTLSKRIFNAAVFLTFLFTFCTAQAEEFYITSSYGNGRYSTPEIIDAYFKAFVQTSTGWTPVNKDAIWKDSDKCKVFIYIHGNLTDMSIAFRDGNAIHQRLNNIISGRNYKLIIWFWNTALRSSPIRGGSINAEQRSQWESFYLARFLQSAPENAEIRLIGYSFGANIALGACHLLSGGTIYGRTSPGYSGKIHSLLIGSAIPTNSFICGKDRALENQVRCWVTVNSSDSSLKWYRFITPDKTSGAMGRDGVAGVPASQKEKIVTYNVTNQVGATHKLTVYLDATGVFAAFAAQ